jgi:hypothetical protein
LDFGVGFADLGDTRALLLFVLTEGAFYLFEIILIFVLLAEVLDDGDAVVVEGKVDLLTNSQNFPLILPDLLPTTLNLLPQQFQIGHKEAVQLFLRLTATLPENSLHLGQLLQILLNRRTVRFIIDQPLPQKLRELLRQTPAAEVQIDARLRLLATNPVALCVLLEEQAVELP